MTQMCPTALSRWSRPCSMALGATRTETPVRSRRRLTPPDRRSTQRRLRSHSTASEAKIDAVPAAAALGLDTVQGIAPAELAARCRVMADGLSAKKLERWLIDENYATLVDGQLVPTEKTLAIDWSQDR